MPVVVTCRKENSPISTSCRPSNVSIHGANLLPSFATLPSQVILQRCLSDRSRLEICNGAAASSDFGDTCPGECVIEKSKSIWSPGVKRESRKGVRRTSSAGSRTRCREQEVRSLDRSRGGGVPERHTRRRAPRLSPPPLSRRTTRVTTTRRAPRHDSALRKLRRTARWQLIESAR